MNCFSGLFSCCQPKKVREEYHSLLIPDQGAQQAARGSENVPTLTLEDQRGQIVTGKIALSIGDHNIVLQHSKYEGHKKGDEISINVRRPLYFFNDVQFQGMSKPAHCIVMHKDDFKTIQNTIHSGAFGGDHRAIQQNLVVVWKHPADLLFIEGYDPDPVFVQVGTYPFVNDAKENLKAPIQAAATKLRMDTKVGTSIVSLHRFVGKTENNISFDLPGISTGNFFQDFNSPKESEVDKVNEMIKNLKELGIDAFSSNGSHHAVILYQYHNQQLTPELFAKLLQKQPRILEAISTAAAGKDKNMNAWQQAFIDVFDK